MIRWTMLVLAGAVVLGMLASLTAVTSGSQNGVPVPFVTVAKGNVSSIREFNQLAIRERSTWLALWRQHARATSLPAPTVDFNRQMVIAIFAGESPAPRRLSIARVVRERSQLVVWYMVRDTRPSLDGEGMNPVTPFHIVRLVHSPLPVRFSQVKLPPVLPQP